MAWNGQDLIVFHRFESILIYHLVHATYPWANKIRCAITLVMFHFCTRTAIQHSVHGVYGSSGSRHM